MASAPSSCKPPCPTLSPALLWTVSPLLTATTMSSSLAQACGDPRDGAVRESRGMLGLGPVASPLPACRCGHSAEGGLSAQGELAPHGAPAAGGAAGLPGEGQGSTSHQSDFPAAPRCAVHALSCARGFQDVGASRLHAQVSPRTLNSCLCSAHRTPPPSPACSSPPSG